VSDGAQTRSGAAASARVFVDARRAGRAVRDYPGAPPPTLADAYAIQDEAIALWPDRIAGWKLGRIHSPLLEQFGAGRLAGPIFAGNVWRAGAEPTVFPVIAGGFAAVEAEYVLELGQALAGPGWTSSSVADHVARVLVGVEIAGSPFAGINDSGPAVTASDFGNNAGLILGAEIRDWRTRLDGLTCRVQIDGVVVGAGGASDIPGGPLDALAFLANHLAARGRSLEAGQLISTGAATGVHRIEPGQSAVADFGPDGAIACRSASGAAASPG